MSSRYTRQVEVAHEELLVEQAKRIRALHEIISRPDLSFEEQIDETLRLGCQLLGTEVGKVGRLDPDKNESEFLNTVVLSDLPARRGIVLPLDKTYCDITFSSPEALAISDVSESPFKDHPAVQFLGIHSYIGTSINVHGKKFGTINFSNRKPVDRPFTEADKDLVNLIGSWISVMMERQLEAEELKVSKDAAEQANQAKSAFLANMSHEIRTPLTAIIGFAETALDDGKSMTDRVSALQIIRRSGDHLLNLINEILDLSKIEAGELDIEIKPINVSKLVYEVESIVKDQAKRKGLQFNINYRFPLPEKINSDQLRLKQILLNLCTNAIKFTDTGSVDIEVAYDRKSNILKYAVKDSGIGLTPEQIDKIFKPFKQADASTARQFGGTGLGLSLSKRLAELLNGELQVKSEYGKGSTFELSLRLDNTDKKLVTTMEEIKAENDQVNSGAHMARLAGNVLLAEDLKLNQQLISSYLSSMGATVTLADEGEMAVNLAEKQDFDLILMDMQMPVMSGIDAVKTLRERNYAGPIVMLTANATLEQRNQSIEAGADDFLTKPIVRDKLYEVLATYLDLANSPDENQEALKSELLQNNPDMANIVKMFVDELPKHINKVTDAFAAQDWNTLKKDIHDLKGMGGGYGYPSLTVLAAQIEQAVLEKSYDSLEGMFAKLVDLGHAIQAGAK